MTELLDATLEEEFTEELLDLAELELELDGEATGLMAMPEQRTSSTYR